MNPVEYNRLSNPVFDIDISAFSNVNHSVRYAVSFTVCSVGGLVTNHDFRIIPKSTVSAFGVEEGMVLGDIVLQGCHFLAFYPWLLPRDKDRVLGLSNPPSEVELADAPRAGRPLTTRGETHSRFSQGVEACQFRSKPRPAAGVW